MILPQVIQFVTFSSPGWRSLNPFKGSLKHPKKVTLNHQAWNVSESPPSLIMARFLGKFRMVTDFSDIPKVVAAMEKLPRPL